MPIGVSQGFHRDGPWYDGTRKKNHGHIPPLTNPTLPHPRPLPLPHLALGEPGTAFRLRAQVCTTIARAQPAVRRSAFISPALAFASCVRNLRSQCVRALVVAAAVRCASTSTRSSNRIVTSVSTSNSTSATSSTSGYMSNCSGSSGAATALTSVASGFSLRSVCVPSAFCLRSVRYC